MAKLAFTYKASIVYLLVNYQNEKSLYMISNNELCETVSYVEQYRLI